MKRNIISLLIMAIVMTCTLNANADDKKRDGKQNVTPEMRAQRNAEKLAQNLRLDDATTTKFIETFMACEAEKGNVYKKYLGDKKPAPVKGEKPERKTDDEIEKEILNKLAMSREIIDIRENYYQKYRKFLNPRQIQYVYSRERDNADHMKKEKNRRDQMKQQGNKQPRPAQGQPAPAQD